MKALVAGVEGFVGQDRRLLHAACLVPLAQQRIDCLGVEFGAAVGQLRQSSASIHLSIGRLPGRQVSGC